MAALHDQLSVLTFLTGQMLTAWGAKRNPIQPPKPLPRPGLSEPESGRTGKGMRSLMRDLGARS